MFSGALSCPSEFCVSIWIERVATRDHEFPAWPVNAMVSGPHVDPWALNAESFEGFAAGNTAPRAPADAVAHWPLWQGMPPTAKRFHKSNS